MEPRITKAEAALMMPFTTPSHGAQMLVEALRQQAAHDHRGALMARLRGVVAGIGAWVERRRAAEALHALGDRELADIGLRRADIAFALRAPRAEAPAAARAAAPRLAGNLRAA